MKRLIQIFTLSLISLSLWSQNPISYSNVIESDITDTDQLFSLINEWFAMTYKSADDVLQMVDKEAKTIVGKGAIKYVGMGMAYACYEGYLRYTIRANVREGRYRIELSDFVHENLPSMSDLCNFGIITDADVYATTGLSKNYHNRAWNDMKSKIAEYSENIFTSLENFINNSSSSNTEEDW